MKGGADTAYLKDTVGEALARGCASTIQAQPNDPVEYLGLWLLKYVKTAEVEGNFYKDRHQQLAAKKEVLNKEISAAQLARERASERKQAVEALAALRDEPRALLQAAVDLIKQHAAVSGAYAAIVAEPEEPDWVCPEDDEAAGVESEDEGDVPAAADGEAPPAEEPPAEEAPEGAEGGEPAPPKIPRPIDYSKKYLAYAVATSGQEFVGDIDVFRPAPPPEDAEEAKPEPMPYTYRILDEAVPMVYLPNVSSEERVKFFKSFPKIGSYQACGVQLPSGEFKAIIAADTLFPEAGGQPLPAEDQDLIWEVSRHISKALDAVLSAATERMAGASAADAIAGMRAQLAELAPQPANAGADAPAEGAGEEGEEEPPAEEAPPAEEEAAPDGGEEGEEGEEGGEAAPPPKKAFDPLPGLRAALAKVEKEQAKAAAAGQKAKAAADLEKQRLAAVLEVADSLAAQTLFAFRHTLAVPQATFHVVKGLLHLLGKEPASFTTWKRAFAHFTPALFQELVEYDASQERNMDVWGRVRSCYKAVTNAKLLETEMPDNQFGVVALQYIKQVRRVARKAAVHRAAAAALEQAQGAVAEKQVAIEEAERAKAEAEVAAAAAKVAAEAEAAARAKAEAAAEAAAAAEAEAGGEGEGGERAVAAAPEGEEVPQAESSSSSSSSSSSEEAA